MPDFYDRQGHPITLAVWAGLLEADRSGTYRRVCESDLADGRWLSTVWLGLNHSFFGGPLEIFETMLFTSRSGDEEGCWRWSSEAEARDGHAHILARLEAGLPPLE